MNSITIYSITNRINGKRYIGQTRQSLYKRWRCHVDLSKNQTRKWKSLLCQDIIKYGKDAFSVEVVAKCNSRDEADRLEIYWMEMYDSFYPNGYNVRTGGIYAPMAEISKQKMRGRFVSEETRKKLADFQRGHKSTPRQLAALRLGWGVPRHLYGEKNPNVRLKKEQVLEIRQLLFEGQFSQEKIAQQFGVKQVTISAIKRRRIWAHLP